MRYKILKGTDLYNQLWALYLRMQEATSQIEQFIKECGYQDFGTSSEYLVGCDAIKIEAGKPEGWNSVGEKYGRYYLPGAKQKEMRDKIAALPRVGNDELNKIVNFRRQVTVGDGGINSHKCPGFGISASYALISVALKCDYTPLPDMIEVLASEFKTLQLEIENEMKSDKHPQNTEVANA